MNELFRKIAHGISTAMGSSWAFIIAISIIISWGISGPIFEYSEGWQLIINTGTTILTFLMVFLIQNTQNRDSKALHLKMDELIHKIKNARNRLIDLEDMPDSELEKLEREFEAIQKRQIRRRKKIKKIRKVAKNVL